MRKTVTLDEDVAAALSAAARERGISFTKALNDAVRVGMFGGRGNAPGYVVPTFYLAIRPEVDIVKANRLVADLEDEALLTKVELRK